MAKILMIDDDQNYLGAYKRIFKDLVIIVECHSVAEAMTAIKENQSDILLLDHSLTEDGNEGLEIAEQVIKIFPRCKIYSTTAAKEKAVLYQPLGIEHVSKTNLKKMKEIVGGK